MANLNKILPIFVVYKVPKKRNLVLKRFDKYGIDMILDGGRRIPLIPNEYEILAIGIGDSFEARYKDKYKIKKITT